MDRWWGRGARLAITLVLAVGAGVVVPTLLALRAEFDTPPGERWQLVVRDGADRVVMRAPLPDGHFALRYRNSLYGTIAEERFQVAADGQLRLVELAADQAAVLDEYYSVGAAPRAAGPDDPRLWRAPPATPLSLDELALAATPLGERALIIDGREPIPLWPLVVPSDPTLVLVAEPVV